MGLRKLELVYALEQKFNILLNVATFYRKIQSAGDIYLHICETLPNRTLLKSQKECVDLLLDKIQQTLLQLPLEVTTVGLEDRLEQIIPLQNRVEIWKCWQGLLGFDLPELCEEKIPEECATVGKTVEYLYCYNRFDMVGDSQNIWDKVRAVVADVLKIPTDEIKKSSQMINFGL